MTGMISRSYSYNVEGKPVMVLRPGAGVPDNRARFVITLDDIWKYSEDHNELFESFLANRVVQLCNLFEISVPKGRRQFTSLMSTVASVIMEGIDELVKMPPRSPAEKPPHSGDVPELRVRMVQG